MKGCDDRVHDATDRGPATKFSGLFAKNDAAAQIRADASRALRCDIVRASLEVLTSVQTFDALVLGSGLAGQALALRLAEAGRKVALITKKQVEDSASSWAQGGIAAVLDSADSIEHHISDTLTAGAGLCDVDATRFVVENGREAIEWLISRGVPFTPCSVNDGALR